MVNQFLQVLCLVLVLRLYIIRERHDLWFLHRSLEIDYEYGPEQRHISLSFLYIKILNKSQNETVGVLQNRIRCYFMGGSRGGPRGPDPPLFWSGPPPFLGKIIEIW